MHMTSRHAVLGRQRFYTSKLLLALGLPAIMITSMIGGTAVAASNGPSLKPPTIISSGQIRYCSDISAPPLESYSPSQTPEGSDVSIGNSIAKDLGLTPVWEQTAFSGIIPALEANHCDAILSQLYIKPARKKVVNFVPYMYSSESVTVPEANPGKITGLNSTMCGQSVSTTTGTTAQTELEALSATCTSDGKPTVNVVLFTNDVDALQNMLVGQSNAYTTTSETAAYYIQKDPNKFKFAGQPFGRILTGIAVIKGNPKLLSAIEHAFHEVQVSGEYNKIMTKWGIKRDEL
jgi:polar amino acid transport system substrate-binding protein